MTLDAIIISAFALVVLLVFVRGPWSRQERIDNATFYKKLAQDYLGLAVDFEELGCLSERDRCLSDAGRYERVARAWAKSWGWQTPWKEK